MPLNAIVVIDQAGAVDMWDGLYLRLNQKFTDLAVQKWDEGGQGIFAFYINAYVNEMWREYTGLN